MVIYDAAVVGGGAAGLAAARTLGRAGRSVIVLEARSRAGGRMHGVLDPRSPAPVEFGPEFIHGSPAVTQRLMAEAGVVPIDDGGASFEVDDAGRLVEQSDDPFERAAAVLARGAGVAPGTTVAELLEREVTREGRRDARVAGRLVSGFDAADPVRASAREIAEEWAGDALGAQGRPSGGYAPLVAHLVRTLDLERVHLRFDAAVRSVAWGSRGVELTADLRGTTHTFRAQRAVITVPIGVLQGRADDQGSLGFEPPLPESIASAIAGIAMGPVLKVVLRFRTPFWERVQGGRLRDAAFFSTNSAFPTYWTQVPQRAPLLTAWAGGPAADALASLGHAEVVALALAGAGALFEAPALAQDECEVAYFHDWQRDPFSRGAYSYVLAGGEGARRRLATPLGGNVLFFAGEATAADGEGGTVAGALQSGERAAASMLSV